MSSKHHNRLLCRASQIPHLDCKVSRACCDKVLILIKVHRQNLVLVSMDPFHVFPLAQVPNPYRLVPTTTSKNRIMGRMPYRLVRREVMGEFSLLDHFRGVPDLDLHIV